MLCIVDKGPGTLPLFPAYRAHQTNGQAWTAHILHSWNHRSLDTVHFLFSISMTIQEECVVSQCYAVTHFICSSFHHLIQ